MCNHYKSYQQDILHFCSRPLKSGLYFTLRAHLNLDAKHESEILNLYLDFIKFTAEQVDLHTQVIPIRLKSFLITETSMDFLKFW